MFRSGGPRRATMSLGECQAALESARQEAAEWHENYLRAAAAIENTRKLAERDAQARRAERMRSFSLDLLDVADNLERALAHASTDDPLRIGVQATLQQLRAALRQAGVVPLDVQPGAPFDPQFHEAIAGHAAEVAHDTVAEVTQTGYMLDGQVLRPARVVVALPADAARQ